MIHPDIQKYESRIEGTGLRANKFIPKNTKLCWKGESDYRELTREEKQKLENRHLVYREGNKFVLCSDGSEYMNHSCNPNTAWLDDDTTIASCDIQANEEITCDYAASEIGFWWSSRWKCKCGSKNCREVILGRDCLDFGFQDRHWGYLPSWTVEYIRKNQGLRGYLLSLLYLPFKFFYRFRVKINP